MHRYSTDGKRSALISRSPPRPQRVSEILLGQRALRQIQNGGRLPLFSVDDCRVEQVFQGRYCSISHAGSASAGSCSGRLCYDAGGTGRGRVPLSTATKVKSASVTLTCTSPSLERRHASTLKRIDVRLTSIREA